MKQWKRLAALSSAIVMAAATLTYFPSDTLQNIRLEISASADETGAETTTEPQVWIEDNLTWTLTADGTLTISGEGAMKDYNSDDNPSPVYNNSDVKKIVIEDDVTSIGDAAFFHCRSLKSITIPDSVTSIGKDAFEACNSLSSITLSNNITSIGDAAFYDCSNLKSITIPDSVTSIESAVFYNCTSLTSITIPNSVTSIGSYAFSDCSSLTSITIPDSVTSIGTRVFYNCTSLTSITIPDSVTSIGYNVFESCSSLTSITIPKSVTIIGSGVFDKCNNLTVYLESGSTLTSNALGVDESKIVSYWNEDNLTWKLDANGTLTISGTGAMKDYDYDSNPSPVYNNSDVKKIVIEDGVTSIGNFAFHSCSSLPSITIPDSVTSIGNFAFESCNSLSSITLSNNITSIGDFAFHGCPLTSITLPDSVTSIGYAAFHSCSNLKSITIPDSVTSIESAVFYNCTSLKTISLSCKSSLKKSDFGDQSDLVSASHTLKKTEAKAATCSDDGNKEYWTCEHCGKYFLSDDTNPETAKAVELSETVIPASHKLTKVEAKDATCTEDGNKEYWTCEHCKKYFLSDDTNPETAKAVELSETVIPALVQVATTTTPIKCVYGQDMSKIDLRDYVKNTDVVGEVTVKVATGSTLPDGMKLDGSKLSGKPAKAYEDGKEVTFTFTAENGNTANLTLLFLVAKADPTVEVAVSGDSHTEGDLVSELKLILSENSTKGVVELVSEIKALVAGKNAFTWKFTPEDENNYNMVTGTVVVNAQTTTTTTTKATTTTTKATTTTKPSKTTTTKATTTTKPSKTTTTKATTTTKPSKTTTTKATTTTKPSKTTTTNATTTNTAIPSYGDVNLDGKVDIVDAIFLNKYLATLIQFSDAQVANADCYQDGVLNDQDTTALMQFIILLIDDLPVQPTEK